MASTTYYNNGLSIAQLDGNNDDWVAQGIWDENINYFAFVLKNQYDSFTFENSRLVSRRSYFGDPTFFTLNMLKSIHVEDPKLVEYYASEIYSNAFTMAQNPNFNHSRVLTLTINVITLGTLPPNHDQNETHMSTGSEEMNEDGWTSDEEGFELMMDWEHSELAMERDLSESAELCRIVPATKLSVAALKEVKVDDLGAMTAEQCSLCMEKLLFENNDHNEVVVSMPCSHLYHKNCMVQWLETNHVCPLCRYAMPT